MSDMVSRARRRAILAVLMVSALLAAVMGKILLDPDGVGVVGWDPSSVASAEDTLTAGDGGMYAYLATQSDSDEPVRYDPCEVIDVVVNLRAGPSDARAQVAAALEEVSERTGLQFDIVSTTTGDVDPTWRPDVDGDEAEPVLIAWTNPAQVPDLAGSVAGLGGSAWVERDGQRRYVTGQVLLDGPQLERLGENATRAVIWHELAHLVGLAHVASRDELMAPSTRQGEWGSGDRAGLAAVGGSCS